MDDSDTIGNAEAQGGMPGSMAQQSAHDIASTAQHSAHDIASMAQQSAHDIASMAQKQIEVILTRQLATYLAVPIFIVDPIGTLIYYNEPAEIILGRRFDETGEMPAGEWSTIFTPTDAEGTAVLPERLPLVIALAERRPAHLSFWIRGLDGAKRHIEVSAFPLIGQTDQPLGAVAMFWELGAYDESHPLGNEGFPGVSGS